MAAKYTWERRVERAEQLAQSAPRLQNVLAFYAEVLKWQRDLFSLIPAASGDQGLTGNFELDHPILLDSFDSLLKIASRQGSKVLADRAAELTTASDEWKEFLREYWNGRLDPEQSFFARACLQPYLERLAETHTLPADSKLKESSRTNVAGSVTASPHRLCPFCGRRPQLTVLSNEQETPLLSGGGVDGGRRFLMCGDCLTLWPFQRIACVNCQEENPDKLSYYCADVFPYIRLECCDTCRLYIKSIDLTSDNRCVPTVDELAAIPLDLWAREHGYRKIQPNLAGM